MSSMLPPSIILPPETAPDEPIGSQTPTVDPNTGLNPYFDQFNQMQQGFQNTMQQIQNDPFPLIEQFLGQRAMSQVDQAMQPMQQEALQKVSSVMSGIRSLVNEAFPNMGGGISTTGQLGQGIASLGGTAIPAAPFTKPAEIPSTPMQPPMMGGESIGDKLFGTKMTDIVGSFGSEVTTPQITQPENDILKKFGITTTNYQGPVTTPAFTGPNSQNTYVGGVKVGGSQPMVGGSGMGNPMANIIANQKASMGQPQQLSFEDDIAKDKYFGDQLFGTKIGADVGGPVTSEEAYNPAMEYNPVFPMPIQKQVEDPLINLAYNFNMENSPF